MDSGVAVDVAAVQHFKRGSSRQVYTATVAGRDIGIDSAAVNSYLARTGCVYSRSVDGPVFRDREIRTDHCDSGSPQTAAVAGRGIVADAAGGQRQG